MAFVFTYTSLTSTILSYLERDDADTVNSVPVFIALGERRIARDLKVLGFKQVVSDSTVVAQPIIAKPNRWLNDVSFNIGVGTNKKTQTFLQLRSYEWCRTYWPDPTQVAQPKYYATDYNYNCWFLAPTPDQIYPYESSYFETPQLIDATVSTNFLTTNLPDLLLFACLLEAASYLKDDERIQGWMAKYELARKSIGEEDVRRISDAYSQRNL